jgi:nicotinamide-nucleotide amidase
VSVRAGIVVTGTEVLTGRVSDRNGPWLAERLRELGVDLAYTLIVGDRPQDMHDALDFMEQRRIDLVVTSGGLGPTADDLTAEVVGRFQGRDMELDHALEQRIAEIVAPLAERWPSLDRDAIALATRKQAIVPAGARVLAPVGTAPGLVVPPLQPNGAHGPRPTVVVLPGPPRELQPMWEAAAADGALDDVLREARVYRLGMLRLFGIPESEIAETLRVAERDGVDLSQLEITTCLKRGEIEVVTRYEPAAEPAYDAFLDLIKARHADTLFSLDGHTVDQQVAELLRQGHTIATAESCTGGQLAARLTDPPGASAYVRGGIVAYSNEAKIAHAAVPAELIAEHGAVSCEVAQALAEGARSQLDADIGVGVTGIAGPDGGSAEKPVGLVWLSVAGPDHAKLTRSVNLPGSRADIRDRATTVAMHLIRRALADG